MLIKKKIWIGIIIVLGFGYLIIKSQVQKNSKTQEGVENDIQKQENIFALPNSVYTIEGMEIEIVKQGAGKEAKNGDIVFVHYVGTLENGEKFDSSIDRGQPFSFTLGLGEVIKGWDLGVVGMKIGEKRKLTIPAGLAYGENGAGGIIPPNATLIFEVELLDIKRGG